MQFFSFISLSSRNEQYKQLRKFVIFVILLPLRPNNHQTFRTSFIALHDIKTLKLCLDSFIYFSFSLKVQLWVKGRLRPFDHCLSLPGESPLGWPLPSSSFVHFTGEIPLLESHHCQSGTFELAKLSLYSGYLSLRRGILDIASDDDHIRR